MHKKGQRFTEYNKSYILLTHSRINVVCQGLFDAETPHSLQNETGQAQPETPCEASAFWATTNNQTLK